jgi:hypothetical protein
MQFSEQWLRTFVDPQLDSAGLGHLLTMAGLEVEEAEPAAPAFRGVVVAKIVEAGEAPQRRQAQALQGRRRHRRAAADRLWRAQRLPPA